MSFDRVSRRRLFQGASAAVLADERPLRVRAWDASCAPAKEALFRSLLLTDRGGRPFELVAKSEGGGAASVDSPGGPFELAMVLPVRGFGQVFVYADNGGALYSPERIRGRELLLNLECARSRAAFVRRYLTQARAEGVSFSPEVTGRIERGEAALSRALQARELAARIGHANDSLAETMWAGETAALERARHHISRRGVRPGFLFGCASFAYRKSEEYSRLFAGAFNFATIPFYRAVFETAEGSPDYSRIDAVIENTFRPGMLLKGHPLVYFNEAGAPAFLKNRPWEDIRQSCRDHMRRTVSRYRSRIHTWDVINEAHDWANDLNLSAEQLVEATRLASETTREADPTAFRIVNSCCTWGQYAAVRRSYSGPLNRRARTPLEYLRALEDARVPYDAVGLQFYYEARDMLELERQIERFFVFGKPVHITELGVASSSEAVPRARNRVTQNVWHGTEWSERIQADWIEQLYTLCFSKPQIGAMSWWDFVDSLFNPNMGLLDRTLRPKEGYQRLARLLASWRGEEPRRGSAGSGGGPGAAASGETGHTCGCAK